MSINSVVIVGRVGQDPDVKYFESGKVRTTFNVAVSRWASGSEKTDWFKISLWDKQAESAGEHVKKGALLWIEGRYDLERWTDNEGSERETTVIEASSYRFLGGKKKEANSDQ